MGAVGGVGGLGCAACGGCSVSGVWLGSLCWVTDWTVVTARCVHTEGSALPVTADAPIVTATAHAAANATLNPSIGWDAPRVRL